MSKRTRPATARGTLLPAGLHIAPYLSPRGRLVLLGIGSGNYLHIAAEVGLFEGWGRADECDLRAGGPSWILNPHEGQGGVIPFLNPNNAGPGPRALRTILWPRGVHYAPWRSFRVTRPRPGAFQALISGRPMMAIDERHRIVAEMLVPGGGDEAAVRREMLAVLEVAEAATCGTDSGATQYADGYGVDDDDSPDDFGDEWNSGKR